MKVVKSASPWAGLRAGKPGRSPGPTSQVPPGYENNPWKLTRSEARILHHLRIEGYTSAAARATNIATNTAHATLQLARKKMGAKSTTQALLMWDRYLNNVMTRKAAGVLDRVERLFKEVHPKFNWGASALDANAIQLLNEVPCEVAEFQLLLKGTL